MIKSRIIKTLPLFSLFRAVTLSCAKAELGTCVRDQVRFGMGDIDEVTFHEIMSDTFDPDNSRRMSIKNVFGDNEHTKRYLKIASRLKPVVQNADTFKLMTMLLVFDTEGLEGERTKYLTMLRRKMDKEQECSVRLAEEDKSEGRSITIIYKALSDIKELTNVVKDMIEKIGTKN